jgi:PPK2 family polyphosphate:nucleotide phosphotransferase
LRPPAEARPIDTYAKHFLVAPRAKLKLKNVDPSFTAGIRNEQDAADATASNLQRLEELQAKLCADRRHSLLIVLQGLDAAGKDGTVDHVMGVLNPQAATVKAFKQPTAEEAAHDFLWRVHPHAPERGSVAIFNRSHYEDVLVTRVHKTIDMATCRKRYLVIRNFEEALIENGTSIVKFFLHISKHEQLKRFHDRLEDPKCNWKISESDYAERKYWDDYMTAYEDAIEATTTKHAPWFVIPADHKWFRNLAVSQIVGSAMKHLRLSYPKPSVDVRAMKRKYHSALRDG